MKLHSPTAIADIRRRHNFQLSKKLGQNFITDPGVTQRIIEGSDIGADDLVIEIGPGIGVLTAEAAEIAAHVTAVEIDKRLIPILGETLAAYDNIDIVNGDILKTDVNALITERRESGVFTGAIRIIGNLPYYITTPIIMKLLKSKVCADSITVMMQKEVADRICSSPGNRVYGAISVAVQYYCMVEKLMNVPKEVFVPRPKVDSAVLKLSPREEKPAEVLDEDTFFLCIRSGFGQRRKTLLNSLAGVRGLGRDDMREVLEGAEIDPVRRAETLSVKEFADIANAVAAKASIRER